MVHNRSEITLDPVHLSAALTCACGWNVSVLAPDKTRAGFYLNAAWSWHIALVRQSMTGDEIQARQRLYRTRWPDHFPPWSFEFRWGQAAHDEDGCSVICSPPSHATLGYRYERFTGWWPAADKRSEFQVTTDWYGAVYCIYSPAGIVSVERAYDPPADDDWTPYTVHWIRLPLERQSRSTGPVANKGGGYVWWHCSQGHMRMLCRDQPGCEICKRRMERG